MEEDIFNYSPTVKFSWDTLAVLAEVPDVARGIYKTL